MNAWRWGTYPQLSYVECKSPQLMRVTLTAMGKSRPMFGAKSIEGDELSARVHRIAVKNIQGRVRKRSALRTRVRGQTECFARGLAAQARPS
jgi:hypothetical protein